MLRDSDCGRQPVGARSHNDGIIFIPLLHVWSFSLKWSACGDYPKYLHSGWIIGAVAPSSRRSKRPKTYLCQVSSATIFTGFFSSRDEFGPGLRLAAQRKHRLRSSKFGSRAMGVLPIKLFRERRSAGCEPGQRCRYDRSDIWTACGQFLRRERDTGKVATKVDYARIHHRHGRQSARAV
jgi:hypothetical protein